MLISESGRGGSINRNRQNLYENCTDTLKPETEESFVQIVDFFTNLVIPPGIVDFLAFSNPKSY
jgi:hypothetical protein